MTSEGCLERHNATLIRLLNTTVESVVQVGSIIGVAVAVGNDTRVYASTVAVPDLEENFWYRLAGVDVNDLDVEGEFNALLTIRNVLPDELALHPVGALSHLGTEDAAVVAREEGAGVRVDSDVGQVAVMVTVEDTVDIASAEVGLVNANRPLGSGLLYLGRTALMHGDIVTALLQRICAVIERTLVSVQVRSAFGSVLCVLLR